MKTKAAFLPACLLVSLLAWSAPSIEFTYVPPLGSREWVKGITHEIDGANYYVLLIIKVFGTYWTKPYWANPRTAIEEDSSWTTRYNTGGQDGAADKLIVYVLPNDYDAPLQTGQGSIFQEIEDHALCKAVADRISGQASITFSGREWTKKNTGEYVWGPGPNHFLGDNAWVDNLGRLHLKISYANGYWSCAEIILTESLGYGIYRVWVDTDVSNLPNNVVFSPMFTYSDEAEFSHREIDVEFSNGDVVGSPEPWQFVVQPYTVSVNRHRFTAPPNMSKSMHMFAWLPELVSFASFSDDPLKSSYHLDYQTTYTWSLPFGERYDVGNLFSLAPGSSTTIDVPKLWQYPEGGFYWTTLVGLNGTGSPEPFEAWARAKRIDTPPPGGEKVHINLWLFNGIAPGPEDAEYEVVISKFTYEPLPMRPRLGILESGQQQMTLEVSLPAE